MKYAIYSLLLLLLIGSCQSSRISHGTETMVIPMDSLDLAMVPNLKDHGIKVQRLSATHAMVIYPKGSHGKVKLKNVGNDYSKVKDTGNYTDKSHSKDKSVVKEKPKVKADIIGDGNALDKSRKFPDWVAWVAILLALLFVLWPKVKRLLFPF